MQVKTFEALTIKDAVKAVKDEFGSDAVILHTRRKSLGDGKGGSMMVEVTAATPENKVGASSKALALLGHHDGHNSSDMKDRLSSLESKISLLAENIPSKARMAGMESGLDELKLLLTEALKTKSGSVLENVPEYLVDLEQRLRIMGMDHVHVASLVKHLETLDIPHESKEQMDRQKELVRAHAMKWLYKKITIAPKWAIMSGSPSIHVFAGPTGVGKTSIIAKVAASFSVKEKAKTVLVSFDHQRLAAAEQLRVYARVMNIPFETMIRPEDLVAVLERHRDAELVLVDTAGRSPKSANFATELTGLNQLQLPIEKHLVLSITEKEMQIDRAIRQYSPHGIQSLIFNKLDESWSYGEIFNVQSRWSVPLSYFGTGQSVPEDIERATRERVVERILGQF